MTEPRMPWQKIYHFGAKIGQNGQVSALCFEPRPHSINLKRALWTIIPDSVTCPKCIEAFKTDLGKKIIEGLKRRVRPADADQKG